MSYGLPSRFHFEDENSSGRTMCTPDERVSLSVGHGSNFWDANQGEAGGGGNRYVYNNGGRHVEGREAVEQYPECPGLEVTAIIAVVSIGTTSFV